MERYEIETGIDIPLPEINPPVKKTFKVATSAISDRTTYIYALCNPVTKMCRYVGKTVDIKNRYGRHCNSKSKSQSARWVTSLKPLRPELIVLEEVSAGEDWIEAECFWIAYLKSLGAILTNSTIGGEGVSGLVFSEEVIKKFRIGSTGRKHKPESILKISEALKGTKHSPERRLKNSECHKDFKHSEESKQKMSNSRQNISEETREKLRQARLDYKHSEETKAKIGDGNRNKIVSKETRDKIGDANRGKERSKETCDKISLATKGMKRREETCERISAAKKLYWANKRAEKELLNAK